MKKLLYELLTYSPENLSENEVSQVLDILPYLEKWMNDFKQKSVTYSQETGVVFPGYQLKEYRRRTIVNKEAVLKSIQDFDPELAQKCLRPQDLGTLAQLEKVLGQYLFEKLLDPHIVVDTSYRLVQEK